MNCGGFLFNCVLFYIFFSVMFKEWEVVINFDFLVRVNWLEVNGFEGYMSE